MRSSMKAALLLVVSAVIGCDPTPCDEALERIHDAETNCPLVPDTERADVSMVCSEEDAIALELQADCVEAATCAALDGSNTAAHRALSECIAGLTELPEEESEEF